MTERSGSEAAPDQSGNAAASRPVPGRVGTAEGGEMTERINAAYASSGPVIPDEPSRKPSTAQRVAAVRAGSSASHNPSAKSAKSAAGAATSKRRRKARLRLTHIDPWSVMKTAFLLAVAVGIVTVVAVSVVWWVLDAAGVWASINQAVGDVVGESGSGFRIEDYVGLSRVLGFTMLVAVVDVILITVIATLGAFLYNLAAALLGGLEVVLAEDEQ